MPQLEAWDLFKKTVEGRVYPASCAWENGSPVFFGIPIKKGSEPNLTLLAEMLRSKKPIPIDIRSWLADMLDPNADSDFQFKKLSKRGRGAKSTGSAANWKAAEFVLHCMETGDTRQQAIGKALGKFGIQRSAIEQALKSFTDAKVAHDAIE